MGPAAVDACVSFIKGERDLLVVEPHRWPHGPAEAGPYRTGVGRNGIGRVRL